MRHHSAQSFLSVRNLLTMEGVIFEGFDIHNEVYEADDGSLLNMDYFIEVETVLEMDQVIFSNFHNHEENPLSIEKMIAITFEGNLDSFLEPISFQTYHNVRFEDIDEVFEVNQSASFFSLAIYAQPFVAFSGFERVSYKINQ